jgi:hypothetical protein
MADTIQLVEYFYMTAPDKPASTWSRFPRSRKGGGPNSSSFPLTRRRSSRPRSRPSGTLSAHSVAFSYRVTIGSAPLPTSSTATADHRPRV